MIKQTLYIADQIKDSLDAFTLTYFLSNTDQKIYIAHGKYRNDSLHIFNIHHQKLVNGQLDRTTYKILRIIVDQTDIELIVDENGMPYFNYPAIYKKYKKQLATNRARFGQADARFLVYDHNQLRDMLAVLSA